MIRDKAKMCGKCGIVADPFWRPLPEVSTRYNLRPMFGLAKTVNASDLEVSLLDVVRLRTSQINSRAHCADMESKIFALAVKASRDEISCIVVG